MGHLDRSKERVRAQLEMINYWMFESVNECGTYHQCFSRKHVSLVHFHRYQSNEQFLEQPSHPDGHVVPKC